jgi:hypothetical protein
MVPLAATTSFTINFLRKPSAHARVIGECALLKVDRSLAVGGVSLYSKGSSKRVAYATRTYSIPPEQGDG